MRATGLVEILGNEFGKENILVHSEFHIQVKTGKKIHDVWLNKFGELKWRLSQSRQTLSGSPHKLIDRIKQFDPSVTDLVEMQSALELSRSVTNAGRFAADNLITCGVFCDAGFKDGKARFSIVKIDGESVIAHAQPGLATDINDAELQAIELALTWYPEMDIFSDSKSAVESVKCTNVRWISRTQNTPADSLANLRRRP